MLLLYCNDRHKRFKRILTHDVTVTKLLVLLLLLLITNNVVIGSDDIIPPSDNIVTEMDATEQNDSTLQQQQQQRKIVSKGTTTEETLFTIVENDHHNENEHDINVVTTTTTDETTTTNNDDGQVDNTDKATVTSNETNQQTNKNDADTDTTNTTNTTNSTTTTIPPTFEVRYNSDGIRLISKEELAYHNGKNTQTLWLSIMSQIFDVTAGGPEYYNEGGPYDIFIGRDGNVPFITGIFNEQEAARSLSELEPHQLNGIQHWVQFYKDEPRYPYIGILVGGDFYDENGNPTEEMKLIQDKLDTLQDSNAERQKKTQELIAKRQKEDDEKKKKAERYAAAKKKIDEQEKAKRSKTKQKKKKNDNKINSLVSSILQWFVKDKTMTTTQKDQQQDL